MFGGRKRRGLAAAAIALACAASLAPLAADPIAAAEPPGFAYFHTYAEAVDELDSVVADHPTLAQKFSIGQSFEGREIWALKLTANVGAGDQGRPAVVLDALMHARERASLEMALYIVHTLTDNYGHTSTRLGRRVTSILDGRVVYVIPVLNPDGAVYDFKDDTFHNWRKNRQPVPDSSAVGIDLNRNFRFKWGCCGGSSGNPFNLTYRGPSPWYAPETVAYRDFIRSLPNVTQALTIHSAAQRILWPFGYTTVNVPATMTHDDHDVFVALSQGMAARNGYLAQQSSDMYISDGDGDDWAYHSEGVFRLTLELAAGSQRRYYPSKAELDVDIPRNRGAILWYIEQADCPYRVVGLEADYCASGSGMQSMSLADGNLTARLASAGRSME